MSLTVYSMEPECVSYKARVKAKLDSNRPEYLEQLYVLRGMLNAIIEKSTEENLQVWLSTNRDIRERLLEERLEREEAAGVADRPEGGEPESD